MTTSLLALADPSHSVSDPRSLQVELGYSFDDPHLLELALRHRSWCAENGAVESNERLEFLGDSVLGIVITHHLFTALPDVAEGILAQRRSELVSARTLALVGEEIGLGPHIKLGKGESAAGGSAKTSILSDAVEAVFGAVFIDGGLAAARPVVLGVMESHIEAVISSGGADHKSRLQELAARVELVPSYSVSAEGPDHRREFTAEVVVGDHVGGSGQGRTKKEAEQAAAASALDQWPTEQIDPAADPGSTGAGGTNGADHA